MLALAVAEGKTIYYSFARRDVHHSVQGLLLAEGSNLAGARVFQDRWTRADRFVLEHVLGGQAHEASSLDDLVRTARPGDYAILPHPGEAPELVAVRVNRRHKLCRLRE